MKIKTMGYLAAIVIGLLIIAARTDYRIFATGGQASYMPVVMVSKSDVVKENSGRVCFYDLGQPVMVIDMACLSSSCTNSQRVATLIITDNTITLSSSLVASEYSHDQNCNPIPCTADCMGGGLVVDVGNLQQLHGDYSMVWGANAVGWLTLPISSTQQCFASP